jgi:lipoteichoic acid synthase
MRAAHSSIVFSVVQHDARVMTAVFAFLTLGATTNVISGRTRSKAVRLLAKSLTLCGLLVLGVYVLDVFAIYSFATRLYLSDLVTFSSELESVSSLVRPAVAVLLGLSNWKLVCMAAGAALFSRACYLLVFRSLTPTWVGGGALLVLALAFLPLPGYASFDDKPLYENVFERNANYFSDGAFSEKVRSDLIAAAPQDVVIGGLAKRLNVIVVVVESLSSYHSDYFSGIETWTPRLDDIARHETALTNFHANGWTTIGGLISIFGRSFPLVPEHSELNVYGSPRFGDFRYLQHPLASDLLGQGYSTTFVAAGDVAFLGQGEWLRSTGFERVVVANKDLRVDDKTPRGPFNSVPDEALFKLASDEIRRMPPEKPFFLAVQTYWSHRPFVDPHGGSANGEEQVIREADAQLGTFYDRLREAHFFDHGVLFITGDHRAPEGFRESEFERFGESAITRVPGIIATRVVDLPHTINEDFQQRDIGASIEYLALDSIHLRPYEGIFTSRQPLSPRCIIHAQGIDRDLVFVKCGDDEATIRTMGDQTKVVRGAIPDEKSVLQAINLSRVRMPLTSKPVSQLSSDQ